MFALGWLKEKKLQPLDKLLYSISHFCSQGEKLYGRKKLMKLIFFLEHYVLQHDTLSPEQKFADHRFVLYKYGPFSFEVMEEFRKLKEQGLIYEKETVPYEIGVTKKGEKQLKEIKKSISPKDKERIKKIKEKFGEYTGKKLEKLSLEYLGVSEREKDSLRGYPVPLLLIERDRSTPSINR